MEGDTDKVVTNSGDATDAKKEDQYKRNNAIHDTPILPTSLDAEDYNMNHANRGTLYIFNHKQFAPKLNLGERNGTDKDRDNMKSLFKKLGFKVKVYEDLTYWELQGVLEKAGKADYSQDDCFACVMLTHGEEGILNAKDQKYKSSELWAPFLGDVCPTLAGKPKLFFIQACQGYGVDGGTHVRVETDSVQVVKIPSHADFLIACSTVPGFYSWRNTSEGSWFIQAIYDVLSKQHKTMDVLSMMTLVNRSVAYNFQSNCPSDLKLHNMKQIPYICSMLTRNVYLRPK